MDRKCRDFDKLLQTHSGKRCSDSEFNSKEMTLMDRFVEEMKYSEQKLSVQLEKCPSERRVDGSLAKPVGGDNT